MRLARENARVVRDRISKEMWQGTNELWWHTSQAVRPSDMGGTDTRTLALRVSSIAVGR